MLSISVFSSINMGLDILENSYYTYLKKQNVEHLSLDIKTDRRVLEKLSKKYFFDYEVKNINV